MGLSGMRTHFSSSPDLFQPPKYPRQRPSTTESPGASWVPHRRFEAWEVDSLQQGWVLTTGWIGPVQRTERLKSLTPSLHGPHFLNSRHELAVNTAVNRPVSGFRRSKLGGRRLRCLPTGSSSRRSDVRGTNRRQVVDGRRRFGAPSGGPSDVHDGQRDCRDVACEPIYTTARSRTHGLSWTTRLTVTWRSAFSSRRLPASPTA
jgi:hypothetical protein